ncbi:lipoyl(octanoyl) transferase LipB [Alkalilimnicola ehrlichii MLHE-1]|uniref:Octanoyltransferase n=1 Tax=Alkalilimnicola ehrlichii (strain ATCC BAA-1101 / DSM 17681 / MLHE-1) TaxID=187272 RepID=LIPB_ALKEH|nr:lipoyl(octanoyl) transferase LipB [Alkalilimnicola ehrlichii]Q0ACA3.1 RecName: Full=Octanoyltransferase; AltName: Full=Lipoate-protein ligase B; AltName: Full=Lipoyl/octanoyl transferase; AltName: Full=Octanoyl-[acyl-carrier-protein]-protein N-octanoyltransferase [Alkalilimnicola ehrlichii MLHE-1]ABI55534.1 lipoate-protein ligase B [Alkalilimnicola ehrlichii MLHE-1]
MPPSPLTDIQVRYLGRRDYRETWSAMRRYTDERGPDTPDQLWVVSHPPVYTLGQAGRREHILDPGEIPVVETDRGGQVTYHGPGQIVLYPLLDLRRWGLGVRSLVSALEHTVISLLAGYGIASEARDDAPGVYVEGRKVASVGLRVRRGCSYHGLAVNVDVDLEPFLRINPCGYPGLEVTRLLDLGVPTPYERLEADLALHCLEAIVEYGNGGAA